MNTAHILHNLVYANKLVVGCFMIILIGLLLNNTYLQCIGVTSFLFLLYFFRNNFTFIKKSNNYFLSPSSSKITKIEYKKDVNSIYTYLSVFDKHFMIAPVDCTIINIQRKPRKLSDSERLRITFKDTKNNIFSLDQIVSKLGKGAWLLKFLYSTRCVVFKNVGDTLKQGERYGLIRFGSNMQYNLPKCYNIIAKENQKYNIGSVLAYT